VYASAGLPTIRLETLIWVGIDTNHMRVYRAMKEEALLYQVDPHNLLHRERNDSLIKQHELEFAMFI
jgi:hypothetical protein